MLWGDQLLQLHELMMLLLFGWLDQRESVGPYLKQREPFDRSVPESVSV